MGWMSESCWKIVFVCGTYAFFGVTVGVALANELLLPPLCSFDILCFEMYFTDACTQENQITLVFSYAPNTDFIDVC